MPKLARWLVRAALLYFALGATYGALILFNKGVPLPWPVWRLLPQHIEIMFFGWLAQFVVGVGFWIFPRFWRSRGDPRPVWLAFGLLNGGIWLIILAPAFGNAGDLMTVAGRLAEIGAVIAFIVHAWPRIKAPGAAPKNRSL